MKARNRFFPALIALLVAAALLPCNAFASGESTDTASKKKVILTYAASRTWVNRNSTIDDELIQKFMDETGIQIDMQVIPDDQYTNVIQTKLSTGEVPDIFMTSSGVSAEVFKPEKYFADLSDQEWVNRYADYAKEITQIDGKTMGFMTWSVDGYAFLYNPEIYAQYNLSVPTNYEEFDQVCQTLLANGITPFYETGKELWHWAAMLSQCGPLACKNYNGNLYADLNSNQVKLADIPELEAYLADLKKAYDAGYFGENSMSNSWDSAYEAMASGKYAGFFTYESWQSELVENYPECGAENWEMYPVPFAGNNMYSPSASAIMRVANKDSENLPEVEQFFDFLAETENLQAYYDNNPALQPNPSFSEVAARPTKGGETFVSNAAGGAGQDLSSSLLYWSDQIAGASIQEMLLGSETPVEVLQDIDDYRQQMFDATAQ
ncbi:MAG: ABC transporter substrate-binding protein [Eubacteriales bacterium]|nr:ABC transporter substrate-binding protein [Eubacteriales bacterium]